jgi:hypothetical protein
MTEINEGSPRAPVTEGQRQNKTATADVAKGQHGASRGQRPLDGQRGQHARTDAPPSVPDLPVPPAGSPPQLQVQVTQAPLQVQVSQAQPESSAEG